MFALDRIKTLAAVAALVLSGGLAERAEAVTYNFENITNNNAADAAAGEAQLFLDVNLVGGAAHFVFSNLGPLQMTIANIYFDFGLTSLLGGGSVGAASPGVTFVAGGAPPDVPGGAPIGFTSDDRYSATNPAPHNGVNVPEFQTIVYELLAGTTFADLIAALDAGSLRTAIHVINYASGGSESFVNAPTPIPLPATGLLLIGALGGLVLVRRRRPAA
ncbi:MAG TPA: VPLPA-CTERM sorting domain-containing protein [Paracoccaceae bacterium]|nr:VPLPA-CTERM sorting domain-containing protein [Paracoccaceae bacterium]HMO70051.1 VPLPA-CTERM sorting domain-containing protein [Paracoccaceae bacterium]